MSKPVTLRPKGVRLLNALYNGAQFEYKNRMYALAEDFSLVVKMFRLDSKGEVKEEVWMTVDYSFQDFMKMAEEMTDDDLFLIGGAGVLRALRDS